MSDWLAKYPDSEAGLEAACIELCRSQELLDVMGWPPIARTFRQYRLGRGIADILLEHADGSVTLIEVKCGGLSLRDYCTGIGQLTYQAVMAASHFQTHNVRKVLATPGPVPVDVVIACAGADIDIMPTMTAEQWRQFLREADELINGQRT